MSLADFLRPPLARSRAAARTLFYATLAARRGGRYDDDCDNDDDDGGGGGDGDRSALAAAARRACRVSVQMSARALVSSFRRSCACAARRCRRRWRARAARLPAFPAAERRRCSRQATRRKTAPRTTRPAAAAAAAAATAATRHASEKQQNARLHFLVARASHWSVRAPHNTGQKEIFFSALFRRCFTRLVRCCRRPCHRRAALPCLSIESVRRRLALSQIRARAPDTTRKAAARRVSHASQAARRRRRCRCRPKARARALTLAFPAINGARRVEAGVAFAARLGSKAAIAICDGLKYRER